MKKMILTIYLVLFTINLFFAVFDRDDFFLPEYVKVEMNGGFSGRDHSEFSAYRQGFKYYLTRGDEKAELTRTEYKACVGVSTDYDKPLYDQAICDGYSYRIDVKFPLRKEKEYHYYRYADEMLQRMKLMIYMKFTESYPEEMIELCDSMFAVFDEYNVNGAYVRFTDDDHHFAIPYGRLVGTKTYEDERYIKINNDLVAEIANAYMYGKGMTKIPYLGSSTAIMTKLTKKITGQEPGAYLPACQGLIRPSEAFPSNFANAYLFVVQKKDAYLTYDAAKFYRLRYFDHVPAGKEIAYIKSDSSEDVILLTYVLPESNENGFMVLESRDLLTRTRMMLDIKLALLTHGNMPVFRGTYMFMHVVFIALVQNAILALVLIIKELKVRPKR